MWATSQRASIATRIMDVYGRHSLCSAVGGSLLQDKCEFEGEDVSVEGINVSEHWSNGRKQAEVVMLAHSL